MTDDGRGMTYRKFSEVIEEQKRLRYLATEIYVRKMLRIIQGEKIYADNTRLVGRIVSEILKQFPSWLDSDMRKPDEELELGPR